MQDLRIKKIRDSIVDKAQDLRVKKAQAINDPLKDKYPSERIQNTVDIKQYTTHKSSEDKDLIAWKHKYEGVTKIDAKV